VSTVSPPIRSSRRHPAPPAGLPRLIPTPLATDLASHLTRFGPLQPRRDLHALVAQIGDAGLRGRGGAGFPTATKLAAVARSAGRRSLLGRRTPVVVANGTEGEPASVKDVTLLSYAPHLVLDGMAVAAAALGADEAVLCVDRHHAGLLSSLAHAVAERAGLDPVPIRLAAAPSRYITGEESAMVHWLNGGDARPTSVPPRPFERGVADRPTLVDNVETLAQLALIARFGAAWWRSVGVADDPGSFLVTITDGRRAPSVFEVASGRRLSTLLQHAGVDTTAPVLVGGYFGSWLSPAQAAAVSLTRADLARFGASLGCGVIAVLPDTVCPVREVARVARWLGTQTAGQCGPCVHGLPAIASTVEALGRGNVGHRADAELQRLMALVSGRGGCKMPDGAVRFVASAVEVFREHIDDHRHGACRRLDVRPVLPVPAAEAAWR
jgi:NADH:ubiquinone oxidoreductase subunit F (NADH-binding)